jgi:hypothetical protein
LGGKEQPIPFGINGEKYMYPSIAQIKEEIIKLAK